MKARVWARGPWVGNVVGVGGGARVLAEAFGGGRRRAAASAAALERDRAAWSCATNRTGHGSGMEIAVGAGLASGDWTRSGLSPEREQRPHVHDAAVSALEATSDDNSYEDNARRTPDKMPESVTATPMLPDV